MPPPTSSLFPYTTLFRSRETGASFPQQITDATAPLLPLKKNKPNSPIHHVNRVPDRMRGRFHHRFAEGRVRVDRERHVFGGRGDRKSTRLNSSHTVISYAASHLFTLSLHDALPI